MLPVTPPSQKNGDRGAPRPPGCSASTPPHRPPRKQPPPRRALPRKALRLEARQVGSARQAAVVRAPVTRIGGMVARAQRRQASARSTPLLALYPRLTCSARIGSATCHLLLAACCLLCYYLLPADCCSTCYLLPATCYLRCYSATSMLPACYLHLLPAAATCYLLCATCYLPHRCAPPPPASSRSVLTYRCYFLPPTALPFNRRHHILALDPPHLPHPHHHLHWFLPCQSHSKGERSGGGADPTPTRKLLPDTIVQAAQDGDVAAVQAWLDGKGNIDARESTSQGTLLMYASVFGQVQLVELLLGRGAGIDLQDKNGCTALMLPLSEAILPSSLRCCELAHAPTCATSAGITALEAADRLTHEPSIPEEQRQGCAEAARLLRQHAAAQTTKKAATTPKGAAQKSVAAGGASGGQRTAGSGGEGTGDSDRRDGGSGAAQASLGSFYSPARPLSTTHLLCSDWPATS